MARRSKHRRHPRPTPPPKAAAPDIRPPEPEGDELWGPHEDVPPVHVPVPIPGLAGVVAVGADPDATVHFHRTPASGTTISEGLRKSVYVAAARVMRLAGPHLQVAVAHHWHLHQAHRPIPRRNLYAELVAARTVSLPPEPDDARPRGPLYQDLLENHMAAPAGNAALPEEDVGPDEIPFSRRELFTALSLALVAAILGFTLTWSRMDHGPPGGLAPVNRQMAEQGPGSDQASTDVTFEAPSAGVPQTYVPYPGSQVGRWVPKDPGDSWGKGPRTDRMNRLPERPTPPPVAVRPGPLPPPPPPPLPAVKVPPPTTPLPTFTPPPATTAPPPPPSTPAPPTRVGLTYPPAGLRPAPSSWDVAWANASASAIRIERGPRFTWGGIALDGNVVLSRWTMLDGRKSAPLRTRNGFDFASVLGGAASHDISVLQMHTGGISMTPLSPEPPAVGEELIYASEDGLVHHARVMEVLPEGHFRFIGLIEESDVGSPLINKRGEIVGMIVGRPWSFPGNSFNLAADTSVLWSLLQNKAVALDQNEPPGDVVSSRVLGLVQSSLPNTASSVGRSDIVAGHSLGTYRLGMSLDELRGVLHSEVPAHPMRDPGMERLVAAQDGIEFVLADGRVVAMSTHSRQYSTKMGTGAGGQFVNINLDKEFGTYVMTERHGQRYVVSNGVEFVIDEEGRVLEMTVVPATTPPTAGGP